jgi:hypothetical protein
MAGFDMPARLLQKDCSLLGEARGRQKAVAHGSRGVMGFRFGIRRPVATAALLSLSALAAGG